jgi:hypothetical protein
MNNQIPEFMNNHFSRVILFALLTTATQAATVVWDGGGGDSYWTNRLNWSTDTPPRPEDDVVIALPAATVLLSGMNNQVTVRSVECDASFALRDGRLNLTAGGSHFRGALEVFNGTLEVSGPGVSLLTLGAVTATNASFYATMGAVMALPGLTEFGGNAFWKVSGPGSVLRLPGLINMEPGFVFNAMISDGGQLLVNNLARIGAKGFQRVRADGTNCLVDLGSLEDANVLSLEAWNEAVIWVPRYTGGPEVFIELRSGGSMPTAQFRQLHGITASAASAEFAGLTNFEGGQLIATDGAELSLPALERINLDTEGVIDPEWRASGTGSVVNLPRLLSVVGTNSDHEFYLNVDGGGQIRATNLTTIADGQVDLKAYGAGSVLDLGSLSGIFTRNTNGYASQLGAIDGGTILLSTQAMLVVNLSVAMPPGHSVLPEALSGSSALQLFGRPGHAYTLEWRDIRQPESPWQFLYRVPMTTNLQVLSTALPADQIYRVSEISGSQPVLDYARIGANSAQITVYGTPGKTVTLESSTELNNSLGWKAGPVITMTNAFQIFPPEPTTGTVRVFRAREE